MHVLTHIKLKTRTFTHTKVGCNSVQSKADIRGMRKSKLVQDPFIKVFDIRTMKQLSPIVFANAGGFHAPCCLVGFFPDNNFNNTVAAVSSSGALHFHSARNVNGEVPQFFQVMGDDQLFPDIKCAAMSSNGEMMAFGTGSGSVSLWAPSSPYQANME
jgi:hypothetical protein